MGKIDEDGNRHFLIPRKYAKEMITPLVTCKACGIEEMQVTCPACSGSGFILVQKEDSSTIIEGCFFCKGFGRVCYSCYNKCKNKYKVKTEEDKNGCFIATAVYGSPIAKEVYLLRCFRDDVLLKSFLGKFFVSFYYKLSPPIAKKVSDSKFLQNVFRIAIITPLLKTIKHKVRK